MAYDDKRKNPAYRGFGSPMDQRMRNLKPLQLADRLRGRSATASVQDAMRAKGANEAQPNLMPRPEQGTNRRISNEATGQRNVWGSRMDQDPAPKGLTPTQQGIVNAWGGFKRLAEQGTYVAERAKEVLNAPLMSPETERKVGDTLRAGVNLAREGLGWDPVNPEQVVAGESEPTPEAAPFKLTPATRNEDGTYTYDLGEKGSLTMRPRGKLMPGQGGTVSGSAHGTYGGYDLRGMSPEEQLQARIAINDRATQMMRETRERFTPKQQPWGADLVGRNRTLREYRNELDQVLKDSKNRRLTARGTANAIAGLRDYYGEALGLSPQIEEAGKNYRAELAAAPDGTPQKPQLRYDFDVDEATGVVRVFDKVSGNVSEQLSQQVTRAKALYDAAVASGNEETAEEMRSLLAGYGYDVEVM